MRRLIVIGAAAVVLVAAVLASYVTPLGATTMRGISAHLETGILEMGTGGARPANAADAAPTPTQAATPGPTEAQRNAPQNKPSENKQSKANPSAGAQDRAYLGMVVVDADNGARVTQVYISSPAQRAGVKKGDVIRKVNGAAITGAKDVVAEMNKIKPGDTVSLVVSREDQELTINVVAGTSSWPKLPEILGHPRIPELEGLGSLPLQQLFGSFLGGELAFEGKDGQRYTIKAIPGKVKTVTPTSISIDPADKEAGRDYEITDKTIVYAGLLKRKVENLNEGDKVVIVVVGDSNRASLIVRVQPGSLPFQKLIPNAPLPGSS